ncbi:aldo/keto reductase [Streptococcus gallolyticus]|uniref:aldo/keto reductase n=1 Tax=Streptococcus gallolyticus TaxID=315405 RepID=UPI002283BC2F|nr:aldo/keto reductase [Streptococcus gallolyticus]MCY7184829.1 aldo/keto reductase [Streptococcus gallolyticus subsp. gallolyticus]MCY7189000.1 aldo/keto reductase [Streptococcus gallolyticus subsp. gallolyticus]
MVETFKLNDNRDIPVLGLGTWMIAADKTAQAVRDALELGYRHIDTAQAYGNEAEVGEGILTSGIPREEIFVTTKVAAEHKTYDAATKSIDESLAKMGLDYIDLMIIHSPQPWAEWRDSDKNFDEGNLEAWRALEDAQKAGKVKSIGVSNFLISDLQNILDNGSVTPVVNQILTHVGNTPLALIDFCKEHNILVEAYSPIAHGEALKNKDIVAMADKYNVSVAQLCIKYVIQLGLVALPKTANPEHMKSNAELDFVISDEDMAILKNIDFKDYGEFAGFPVFSGK